MNGVVDQTARTEVADVRHRLNNHEQITNIKLEAVDRKVDELKSILKWVGGLIVALFISTLTWSLSQQWNANEAQKLELNRNVELLREQQRAAQLERELRNSGGTVPALPASTGR